MQNPVRDQDIWPRQLYPVHLERAAHLAKDKFVTWPVRSGHIVTCLREKSRVHNLALHQVSIFNALRLLRCEFLYKLLKICVPIALHKNTGDVVELPVRLKYRSRARGSERCEIEGIGCLEGCCWWRHGSVENVEEAIFKTDILQKQFSSLSIGN